MITARTLRLGDDLVIDRVGYSAMHLTGRDIFGETEDPDHAVRLLRRAAELGVNFIDAADPYGSGTNERILHKALYPYPDDLVIRTRGGPRDRSRDSGGPLGRPPGHLRQLRRQVENSLRNLGLDRIDLYHLHHLGPSVPLGDQLGELARLRQEGKIRHIGLSAHPTADLDTLTQLCRCAGVVAVENGYNLADRTSEPALRHAEQHGIAFVPRSPFDRGDLAGPANILDPIAADFGATAAQLALAWLLHRSPVTLLVPGTTCAGHLEDNMRAADLKLTDADLAEIVEHVDSLPPVLWRRA
ncbi:aldo/keto reductase [Amycolatopsis lurida]